MLDQCLLHAVLPFVFIAARSQDVSLVVLPPKSYQPARKHNCVRCLKYAISWNPDRISEADDGIDISYDIACVPFHEEEPTKCKRCHVTNKPCIPGNRKIGRVLKSFDSHIDMCIIKSMTLQKYEDDPTTKELRKKGRKALSTFRVVMSANASASAAVASEQRRAKIDEHLASVSSNILATLIDISNTLANSGLPRVGPTEMPQDCVWDKSDDGYGSESEGEDDEESEDDN
ncbi:unnamed protein product [Fusarium equiseti]|uniref:Uncharacterized protein n=1 Tax=Fusarium equiseti TaxID=61235 RepID=A0A8J2JB42_FUSEQ|nr:unnamed protein product [Fusarium equiseti]